jgi:hypothetical protein
MQKNALALASPKTRSPPQITDGFCGNTAKFYFDILKYCVSNSYNIFSGKRNDEEDIRIIWDTLPIMEKSGKIDSVWFLNFILATKKKELVVCKKLTILSLELTACHFFLTTSTVRYTTPFYATNFNRGELNSKGMRWFLIKIPTAIRFSAKFSVFYIVGPSHENYHKP